MLRYTESEKNVRPVVQVSLGPHVEGAALPHVDPSDSKTVLDGIKKRIAVSMPRMPPHYRQRFRAFVREWLKNNLTPLPPETDYSVPVWLSKTNYPLYRRTQLQNTSDRLKDFWSKRHDKVKSFIKDETYNDFKHARTINSRSDEFKTIAGPYVKAIEKVLFKLKWFIKYVPKKDRPKVLLDRFGQQYKYNVATDFASYEAHFDELLEDTEFELYEYMLQYAPMGKIIIQRLRQAMLNFNLLVFKYATVKLWRRRMSGEMSTSMGNGFANLMLIMFIMSLQGETVDPFVEGDDGLFGCHRPPPSKQWLYDNLGLDLKMDILENVNEASFCGNIFDTSDLLTVTNPIDVLLGFGWTTNKYARASQKTLKQLLRAKSYSLLYEYPGHPILQSLALYGLRVTSGLKAKFNPSNYYERENLAHMLSEISLDSLPAVETPKNTRMLVQKLYGVTIEQQLSLEHYFNTKNDLLPIDLGLIDHLINRKFKDYYTTYHRAYPIEYSLDKMMAPIIKCC